MLRSRLVSVLLLSVACAASKPAAKQPIAAAPSTLSGTPRLDAEAAFRKESEPLAPQPVQAADFKASIESAYAVEVIAKQGFTQINGQLGEGWLSCAVYPGEQPILDMLAYPASAVLTENRGWLDVHGDQIEGVAYVLARARHDDGHQVGDLKVGAAVLPGVSVVCAHDAPGLYASFERVLRGFIASLELAEPPKQPAPSERSIVRVQNPGRFVELKRMFTYEEPGETRYRRVFTSLRIDDGGALTSTDETIVTHFAHGTLQAGEYTQATNGQSAFELHLKREGATFKVSGVLQGQPITGEFPALAGFRDERGNAAEVCKVRAGKLQQSMLLDFVPSHDPLHASTLVVEKNDTPEGDVRMKLEGDRQAAEMFVHLDEACEGASGIIKMGSESMPFERIFHQAAKR
jgi:hypothetical protein